MERSIKDFGEKIDKMGKEQKLGLMGQVIKETMWMAKNMEKENLLGLMEVHILVNS
jgi:hypothetical protein